MSSLAGYVGGLASRNCTRWYGTPCYERTYGIVCPYEDEIRSVEGPDARGAAPKEPARSVLPEA